MKLAILAMVSGVAACTFAGVPVFYDDFDTLYSLSDTFVTPTNGWQGGASVANDKSVAVNSAKLGLNSALTNTIASDAGLRVWTDFLTFPQLGIEPDGAPTNIASFLCYFNTNGSLVVATPSGWRTCTNDIWGNAVAPATNADVFVRISYMQDYATSTQAVFLNGQLLAQDLPFVSANAQYNQFVARNTDNSCWLDNVWIKTNFDATTLTSNYNGDAVADAEEVHLYGYAARTLHVYAGATNLLPVYSAIASALTAWRPRDTIHVVAGDYSAESLTIPVNATAVPFTGDAFTVNSLTVPSGSSISFAQSVTCSTLAVAGTVSVAAGKTLAATSADVQGTVTVAAGGQVTATTLAVGASAVINAPVVAGSVVLSGTAAMNGTVTVSGALTVSSGASVTLSQAATAGSLSLTGSLALASSTLVVDSLTVSGAGQINVANSGSFAVTGAGVILDGPVSISNDWTTAQVTSMPLTLHETFDAYGIGSQVSGLKFRGWDGAGGASIQAVAQSGRGVQVPDGGFVTNHISTTATKVWSDFYIRPVLGAVPDDPPTNSSSFVGYTSSNGYLVVATADGWLTCSNKMDLAQTALAALSPDSFARISVMHDLAAHTFAVFLNGELVAQNQRAPAAVSSYTSMGVDARTGWNSPTYFDEVTISTNYPATLTSDLDGDLIADAQQVHQYGHTFNTLYVCTTPTNLTPVYASITNALAVWSDRDVIHVIGSGYSGENLVLPVNPSNVVFKGDSFTANSVVVPSGAHVVFTQSVSCATLSLTGAVTMATGQSLTSTVADVAGTLTAEAGGALAVSNLTASGSILAPVQGVNVTLSGTPVFGGMVSAVTSLVASAGASATFSNAVTCGGLSVTGAVALVNGASLTSGVSDVAGTVAVATPGVFVPATLTLGTGGDVNALTFAGAVSVQGNAAVDLALTASGALTVNSGVTLTMGSGAALTSGVATVNGTLVVPANAEFVPTDLTVGAAGVVNAATRAQGVTIQGAGAFQKSLLSATTLVVPSGAAASFAQSANCGTLLATGYVAMASGASLTSTAATVAGALSVAGGATFVTASLDLRPDGAVTSTVSRVHLTQANVTLDGTFVLKGTTFGATFGDMVLSGNATVSGNPLQVQNLGVAASGAVTFGQTVSAGSLSVTGTMAMAASASLTSTAANVEGTLSISNGSAFVAATLTIGGAGQVVVTAGGTAAVTGEGFSVNGPTTLTSDFLSGDVTAQPLNFLDTFDSYGLGSQVSSLKSYGWNASGGATIGTVAQSGRGVTVADGGLVTNSVTTAAKKMWTDFYIRPMLGAAPDNPPTNSAFFVGFVNSNGYLVVATSNGWYTCSNKMDQARSPATPMTADAFTRITVIHDLNSRGFAVMVDGDVVAQELQAPSAATTYRSFGVDARTGWGNPTHVDEVRITTEIPPGLVKDIDGDGELDADEIFYSGTLRSATGSVYLIR